MILICNGKKYNFKSFAIVTYPPLNNDGFLFIILFDKQLEVAQKS